MQNKQVGNVDKGNMFFFFLHKQARSAYLAWEKKSPHLFLACCDLLFRCLTTRCPHNTDRGLSLSPARSQPPPGGNCGSMRLLFISPLCGPLGRPESNSDDSGRVSSAGIQQTDQQPRVQTNPELTRFPKCLFHGNGSPEVFLRTVKVWRWRGRTQQGDASNGERLKSTHLNPTSSTRYLCLFVVV